MVFTLRNTEEHFHTFAKTLGVLDFARIGVDMNPLMGDYGFAVNEQVDACEVLSGCAVCKRIGFESAKLAIKPEFDTGHHKAEIQQM